jgi:iron complex outermembrane receptor protein
MSIKSNILFTFLLFPLLYSAQIELIDSIQIKEAVVIGAPAKIGVIEYPRSVSIITSKEIIQSGAVSIGESLETVAGVDLRQRGALGVQSDLTIRGGSFEQAALFVNGIRWSAPHTGHHLMDITFDPEDVNRIEVVKGGASPFVCSGAFSGTVQLFTGPSSLNRSLISIGAGSYGWWRAKGTVDFGSETFRHRVALSRSTTSGYQVNTDAEMLLGSYSATLSNDLGLFQFHLGVADKQFGAQDFYTASYPTQYEETRTLQTQLSWGKSFGNVKLMTAAYCRSHKDKFELFRESEGYYEQTTDGFFVMDGDTAALYAPGASWYNAPNNHISLTKGVNMKVFYDNSLGLTALRIDIRDEAIYSNLLGTVEGAEGGPFEGDSIYTRADRRTTKELSLSHRVELGRFASTLSAAILDVDSGTILWPGAIRILPGADLTIRLDKVGKTMLFGSANRSVRQPSFTDLYYSLGGAQGSIDLEPEWSDNFEAGVRAKITTSPISNLKFEQSTFIRNGHNLIDWVRLEGETTTQATNLREVVFKGFETSLMLNWKNDNLFRVSYTSIKASESSVGFESNYVLDFLRHKLDIVTSLSLPADLKLSLRYSLQDREGGYYDPVEEEEVEFVPTGLLGATLSREFMEGKLNANIRVDNAFDVKFVDIGNVVLPGRWMRASLTFVFD